MSNMCLIVTPAVEELANKIQQSYPEACKRIGFNNQMCAGWIGLYNNDNSKDPDSIPEEKSLVNYIEKLRNKEGKSFLRDLDAERRQVATKQEMQEIKSKAIADGTFMKAPNGIPTNLNEEQWLQVRTKAFKDWFGDWINDPANASKVVDENGEPLAVYHGSPSEFTEFDKNLLGTNTGANSAKLGFFFSKNYEASRSYVGDARFSEDQFGLYASIPELEQVENEYYLSLDDLNNEYNYRYITKEEYDSSIKKLNEWFENEKKEIYKKVKLNNSKVKSYFLNIRNMEAFTETTAQNITDSINKAISEHADGVVLKDIKDPVTTDDYVVFNPNQIKSATDNNGVFSTGNNNILASPQNYEEVPVEVVMEAADAETAITAFDSKESSDPDLDKKFGDKTDVSVSEMLNSLIANNTPFEGFVKALQDNIGELGSIRIQLVPNSNTKVYGIAGVYSTLDNTIYINRNANYKGKDGKVDNTIIHEIIHAIVANSLSTTKHREELGKLFDEAREKILKKYGVEAFDELPEYLKNGRLYGLQNLDEFAAEFFTNSEFILELNDENTFGKRSDKKSLFNRLVEWIKSLLPKGVTETYKRSGEILEDIILNSGGSIQNNRSILARSNSAANTQAQDIESKFKSLKEELSPTLKKEEGRRGWHRVYKSDDLYNGAPVIHINVYNSASDVDSDQYYRLNKEGKIESAVKWASQSEDSLEWKVADNIKYSAVKNFFDNIRSGVREELGETSQQQPTSTIDPRFKQGIETLAGYYEGGGRLITDDFPGVPKELDDKLDNHFMGGKELSDDDYRELAKYISVVKNTDASTQFWPYIAVPKRQTQQQPKFNVSQAEFYSGAAMGSDTVWATEARKLGINVVDYTVGSYEALSPSEKAIYDAEYKVENEYKEVARTIGKNESSEGTYTGKLLRRDMMQADSADAIFAIGTINSRGYVDGGTGYATTRGIIRGIPVFVYDRRNKQWKIWSESSRKFINTSEPVLTLHAAVIGTRGDVVDKDGRGRDIYDINEEEKQVIRRVLANTVGQQASQPSLSPSQAISTESVSNSGLATSAVGFEVTQEWLNRSREANERNAAAISKPKPVRQESKAFDSALKPSESRMAQFSRTFSPQQIKDRGAMIADIFSDILDDAVQDEIDAQLDITESDAASEEEKTQARQRINALKDPVKGRQLAAQEVGIPAIIREIKNRIQDYMESAEDNQKVLYQNTIDYFEDLFNMQASLDIEEREGIRIINLDIAEQTTDEDNNDSQDDGDDDVGHVASGSDGWSYRARYEDPFSTLAKKVKSMLYDVNRPEGEVDDLGMQKKYPMGQIYASLLSYLSKHMENADDFIQIDRSFEGKDSWGNDITEESYPNGYPTFPVLEEMKGIYPWVEQIIQRLTDDYLNPDWNSSLRYPSTGGAMASQFYVNFRKAYIPYGKVQLGDGTFGITPLNYQMEDRVQRDKLEANYNNRMVLTEHSIYNTDGKVNKEHAEWLGKKISEVIFDLEHSDYSNFPELIAYHNQHPDEEALTQDDIDAYNRFIADASHLLKSFGIDATQDGVVAYLTMNDGKALKEMLSSLSYAAERIKKLSDENVDDFNYIVDLRNPYGENVWEHFFDGKGMITDASYMQSFYDSASKKTKYSYSADNYLMKIFRGVSMGSLEERRRYIDEHFGKYEWFRDQQTGEWRNSWLEYWYNTTDDQNEIPYRNIDNITERSENGPIVRQYSEWTHDDIWQVQNRSYNPESKAGTSFYLSPIFSDSPMSMTVKGPKLSMDELLYGYVDDNKVRHQGALIRLINQELYRINLVQQRKRAIEKGTINPISNFDTGCGVLFCFIPELNNYVFEDTRESFIERMVRLKAEKATASAIEESQIQAVESIMNDKMGQYIEENRVNNNSHPVSTEQYLNMVYASASIIQLTTVDLAFYGKGKRDSVNETIHQINTDFQKRFKEVYAGGNQLNTNSKYGKKTENIILLSDDKITSPSYSNVVKAINASSNLSEQDKKDIIGLFEDNNVADAQAIRAMHSFRSVLDMMGKWDNRMDEALQHFHDNDWRRDDFDLIFQTIKPFVYSVIERNDGTGNSMLVPQQDKNSEICALMMYDLIANGLNNSPVYKALSRFMEDTKGADGVQLIDMAQFESAGKVGNQGTINISFNPDNVVSAINNGITVGNKEIELTAAKSDSGKTVANDTYNSKQNYEAIKEQLDAKLKKGDISQEEYNEAIEYLRPSEEEIISILKKASTITNPDGTLSINPEVVHTIPFDNYYQQQPTPEHHIDANATFGSQARNIVVADLPDDFSLTVSTKDSKKHTFKGKDAVIDFYYELLNENLIEDYFHGHGGSKGLKEIFESKEALRDAVTEIVRGNPKYGKDFAEAMQIDDNGNFVLDPNSPTVFNLMQEIITSFFKNRITKQAINGAALIQAAGIGLDNNLRLIFDEDNNLTGAECYMPLTSKRLFEPLLETKTINGKTVKALNPEKLKAAGLDRAIGYRIPTENKSSMLPLIIKDFTPLQNGSAIVLPAEITTIAGSDFDVDKMFVMLSEFYVQNYDMKKALKAYDALEHEAAQEMINALGSANIEELDINELPNPNFKEWFELNKEDYLLNSPVIRKIEYDFSKTPKQNGRKARNNMVLQMMYGILTSKEGTESVLNPQGFKDMKRAAKITRILTDRNLLSQLIRNTKSVGPAVMPPVSTIVEEFLNTIKERYPYKYNDAAKTLRSLPDEIIQQMYIQSVSSSTNKSTENNVIDVLLDSSTKDLEKFISTYSDPESPVYPQTFAHSHEKNMAGMIQIGIYAIQGSMAAKYQRASVKMRDDQQFIVNDRRYTDVDVSEGGSRLKNVGQMIGASADNGKDPNLSDMGSTSKTAPIIGYMLRTGLSHLEAALIINQYYMYASGYNPRNYEFWTDILGKVPGATPAVNVTTEMLIKNLINPVSITAAEDMAIAALCYRILRQSEAQEYMTQVSRADSPNGAMQNSYAKARIQTYKVDLLQAKMTQPDFPFIYIKEALNNNAVDTTASEDTIRQQLASQPMGLLYGMYSLGINSFQSLVAPYFFGTRKWFDDSIVKPILYNMNERLSDSRKEEVVNNIYKSYITYILSGSPLFGNEEGNTIKQKREYYLESFPDDYIKVIQENEDIRNLLSTVLQVKNFGSRKRVVLQDVGSLSKGQKQDVQRRLESLIYSDNPAAKKLASDLFVYSYFDNGLQFTHNSFSHLFTTNFLIGFSAYTDTLNKLGEKISDDKIENFINQFFITYPDAAFNANRVLKAEDVVNDTIKLDLQNTKIRKIMVNELMSPNPRANGINVYPYITYGEDIYALDKDLFEQFPGIPTYHKLSRYKTFPKLPLLSIQMSVEELSREFPYNASDEADTSSVDMMTDDPSVDANMYETFNNMDDDFDFIDPSDFEGEPVDKSDTFKKEGEGELQNPMCSK